MTDLLDNPIISTRFFIGFLIFVLIISIRPKKTSDLFPPALTQEMKGLAILSVIFAHIGLLLISDHRFLAPISYLAGIGVNLFLFLSGLGLTMSALRKDLPPLEFYKQRLLKLYIPFWLALLAFILMDYFVLNKAYSLQHIGQSFIGFFPRANAYLDINSPLWYFTLIASYYIIFPLVFMRKRAWLSALIIYAATYIIVSLELPILSEVSFLYRVHLIAFPLGVLFAPIFLKYLPPIRTFINIHLQFPVWGKNIINYSLLSVLFGLVCYTTYHSGVGETITKEQAISLISTAAIVLFFIIKKFEIKLLSLFGLYSYEIYLLHWPLMARYDFLFKYFPGWLATIMYLIIFICLAWIIQKISKKLIASF